MRRTKKLDEIQANFAKHPQGECSFCDANAPILCNAFQQFVYSGGCKEEWHVLRSKVVPGTGRIMGRTVWQLVCAADQIQDIRGGRFADGGEIPTPEQVLFAITTGFVVEG